MINALLITSEKNRLNNLSQVFEDNNINVSRTETGDSALTMISESVFDVVIIDEKLPDMKGLEFAEKLVKKNPMINCAVVSSLSSDDYHEASEGLGLLMQIPVNPTEEDARKLFDHLKVILDLTAR